MLNEVFGPACIRSILYVKRYDKQHAHRAHFKESKKMKQNKILLLLLLFMICNVFYVTLHPTPLSSPSIRPPPRPLRCRDLACGLSFLCCGSKSSKLAFAYSLFTGEGVGGGGSAARRHHREEPGTLAEGEVSRHAIGAFVSGLLTVLCSCVGQMLELTNREVSACERGEMDALRGRGDVAVAVGLTNRSLKGGREGVQHVRRRW